MSEAGANICNTEKRYLVEGFFPSFWFCAPAHERLATGTRKKRASHYDTGEWVPNGSNPPPTKNSVSSVATCIRATGEGARGRPKKGKKGARLRKGRDGGSLLRFQKVQSTVAAICRGSSSSVRERTGEEEKKKESGLHLSVVGCVSPNEKRACCAGERWQLTLLRLSLVHASFFYSHTAHK
jgi:hypothetical protein